jgi:uncharacterized protein YqeY
MNLSERLNEDMKQFMKSGNKFSLSVVRMLRSAVKNVEIDQRKTLGDDEVLDILNREMKQRRDARLEFDKAGRQDLVTQIDAEIAVIQTYMPQPLTEDELQTIVAQTIQEMKASSKSDMGKVMSALMPKVKGRADGKKLNETVMRMLS